jgi:hypothetical protein
VADADDEPEGVELEDDCGEPDDDDVPLGVLEPDEEPLLEDEADEDELPLGAARTARSARAAGRAG